MGEDNFSSITPEKQLLKLIEDPDGSNIDKVRSQYKARKLFSMGFLKSAMSIFGKTGTGFLRSGHEISIDFQALNWLLKICIVAAAAYLVIDISSSARNSGKMPNIMSKIDISKDKKIIVNEAQSNLMPFSFYKKKVDERNIFKPYEEKVEEVVEEVVVVPGISATASSFVSELEVVGIAWSDEPDAIVHNGKINRTYFLKKGSKFGDAKVIDIFEDRIVIEYDGEEVELK